MAKIRQQLISNTGDVVGAEKYSSDVDALADGGWISTWVLDFRQKNDVVFQTRFDAAGNRVGNDVQVDSSLKGPQSQPATTSQSDGGWDVAFTHGNEVVVERFDKGGHHVDKLDIVKSGQVTMLKTGGYIVTWSSYVRINESTDIYQQRYDTSWSIIGGESRVSVPHKYYDQYSPHVTALADGGWINQYRSEWFGGYAWQRFDADGSKIGQETKAVIGEVTAGLPDGGWVSAGEVDGRIRMLQFDRDGEQINKPILVTDVASDQSYSPTITALPSGGWLITSTDRMIIDEPDGEFHFATVIRQRQYDGDGHAVGDSRQVSDSGSEVVGGSSVSLLKDGGWVVAWTADEQAYQKRYDNNGNLWFKNDAPIGANGTISVEGNGSHRFSVDDFQFVDKNGDHLKGVLVDTIPSVGRLTVSGRLVKAGEYIDTADIAKMVWQAPANKVGADVATLSFRVVDDGGTAHRGTDTDKVSNVLTFDLLNALRGTSKADVLVGSHQADMLLGYSGADNLTGGRGADELFGGKGADLFIFRTLADSTVSAQERDNIVDFSGVGKDRIDLGQIDANTKIAGNQAFSFIGKSQFHGKAGEVRYEKKASDTYIYADVNGDKKADFAIHLEDALTVNKGYFVL